MSGIFLFNSAVTYLSVILVSFLLLATFGRMRGHDRVRYFQTGLLFLMIRLMLAEAGQCLTPRMCEVKLLDIDAAKRLAGLASGFFASFSCVSFGRYLTEGSEKSRIHTMINGSIILILLLYIPSEILLGRESSIYPIFGAAQLFMAFIYVIFSLGSENKRMWLAIAVMFPIILNVLEIHMPFLRVTGFGMTLMYQIAYMNYQVQLENELARRELELSDTKVRLLMQQISPHFIFNSLQVIQSLCDDEPEKVKPAIAHFSGYLRGNLESLTTNEMIPFKKELEHTGEYIKLEQLSDGREFEVEYRLGAEDFMMPPLILQPIVENAIRYGIGTHSVGEKIVVSTEEDSYQVVIRVSDDGHGDDHSTDKQKNRQSVGLTNIKGRLKAQCNGRLMIDKREDGTTVSVIIPKKR